jgi:hypothetical protein
VDQHPPTVDIGCLQRYSFADTQAAGINSAQANPVPELVNATQYLPDFFLAENDRQLLFPRWTYQLQRGPFPLERILVQELDRT